MEKVKVTLNLLPEAAEILSQYASERTRGEFISGLLLAQRRADDAEGARLFALAQSQRQAAQATAQRAAEAVTGAVREKYTIPGPSRSSRKSRKGRK